MHHVNRIWRKRFKFLSRSHNVGIGIRYINMWADLEEEGLSTNSPNIPSALLRKCAKERDLSKGRRVHDLIKKSELENDVYLENLVLHMYGVCGALEDARAVFDSLQNRNLFSWNIMITAYTQQGHIDEALTLFRNMPERNVVSWNAMIAGYIQQGKLEKALDLFQDMPMRNAVSWNLMISAYGQKHNLDEAIEIFHQMPNPNVVSWTTMINAYIQHGIVCEAGNLFEQMPHRNVVSWNTMISGYAKQGKLKEAWQLFEQMPRRNIVSWNAMIAAYSQHAYLNCALELFQQMPQRNVVSWTSMVTAYAEDGQLKAALELFNQMPSRNIISWNTIISAFSRNGQIACCFELLHQLQEDGMKPDVHIFNSILDVCATCRVLGRGKWVHATALGHGFDSSVTLSCSLINMYAECGSLEDAVFIFEEETERNAALWNSIIAALNLYHYGKYVIQSLLQMHADGITPDKLILENVLWACCCAEMVDDGSYCFASMGMNYGVVPTTEHYTCMICILNDAGWLEEVEALNNILLVP